MKKKTQKYIALGFIFLMVFGVLSYFSGLFAVVGAPETKLAVPVTGYFSCEPIDVGTIDKQIPSTGTTLSLGKIGVYTPIVTNVKVVIEKNYFDTYLNTLLLGSTRIRYEVCDKYDQCTENTKTLYAGTITLDKLPSAIDLREKSVFVIVEKKNTLFSSWSGISNEGMRISYSVEKFGLRYYSPSVGSVIICSSGCDLTCPAQSYRQKLIYNPKTTLDFYEKANTLERWEDVDYDLNTQYGGTIYNTLDKKFCLGGNIYSSATLRVNNVNYIYPDTATRQKVDCCVGATISTSAGDKTCSSNYLWVEAKDNQIKCISDLQCPASGLSTCSNFMKSGWDCVKGYCQKEDSVKVDCCSASDCGSDLYCQDNKCVGGSEDGDDDVVVDEHTCVSRNAEGQYRYEWIEQYQCVSVWCKLGLSKPLETGYCKDNYMVYFILLGIGGFLIILTLIIVLARRRR